MQKGVLLFLALLMATPALAQIPSDVSLDPVPGLPSFSTPVGLKNASDDSGRLFVIELGGTIRVIDSAGSALSSPFVNLGSRVTSGGERGLLDIAFHPEYGVTGATGEGKFYLHYSAGSDRPPGTDLGDTIIAEFNVSNNPNIGSSVPARIILTVPQDFGNHNGGQMRFGADGFLYIGLGDGGSGNDPCNRAQTLNPNNLTPPASCGSQGSVEDGLALLGKMLRIDVDNTTPAGSNNLCGANGNGSAEYAVPAGNPYFGQSNRCGEVLLYGLRNPWRWSFDSQTQDMWIGDVGQGHTEEINLLDWPLVGGNLGWDVCEGSTLSGSSNTPCSVAGSVLPVMEYGQTGGNCSVTGGYRYRGPVLSLQGRYIFADFCTGNVWFGREAGGTWISELFGSAGSVVRSLGQDEQGNVYMLVGSSLRIFNGATLPVFADGFE